MRAQRIPTRRSFLSRAGDAINQAVDKHPALPFVVVLVALIIINS